MSMKAERSKLWTSVLAQSLCYLFCILILFPLLALCLIFFGNFCRRWDSSTRLAPDEALQHEWIIEVYKIILNPDLFPCISRV